MNDKITQLLRDAASVFENLASEIEQEQRGVRNRLDALDSEVHKNKQTLKRLLN